METGTIQKRQTKRVKINTANISHRRKNQLIHVNTNMNDIQKEKMRQIYKALQREFNRLDMLDRGEDNEHRHEEMDAIRAKCKKELDIINATNKQRQDVTTYVIGNAKFLQYFDWVDEMNKVADRSFWNKTGYHIF